MIGLTPIGPCANCSRGTARQSLQGCGHARAETFLQGYYT
jgi:hypothetical protein